MTSLLSGLLFGDAEDSAGSHSSGYGGYHSGPHSGSGSGIDRSGHGNRHSGGGGYGHSGGGGGHSGGFSGHSGHSGHGDHCCPLVVDALCLAAILGSIAGATVLIARTIQLEITMTTGGPGRRKRSLPFTEFVLEGKHVSTTLCMIYTFERSPSHERYQNPPHPVTVLYSISSPAGRSGE